MSASLFSIEGLFEAIELQGSFRGVGFWHVGGDDEPGRRVQEFLFPGQDIVSYQDLGLFDRDIVVKGILSGADYTSQADALRAAFWTAGPGTLVSPWVGTVQVVQAPGKSPKFSYSHDSLRIITFTATFRRYKPPVIPGPFTLQGLLNAIRELKTAGIQMLGAILAPVALVLGAVSQVESMAREIEGIFGSLVAAVSDPQVPAAAAPPIALLANINATPLNTNYPPAAAALLGGPSTAIAATTTPAIPAAVAPGGAVTTPTPVDGRVTAGLILSAIEQLATVSLTGAPIPIPPGPALILCGQVLMLADVLSAASAISFDSQQEAVVWRTRIAAVIEATTVAAAALVPSSPTAASALWRSLIGARSAWAADMNTVIGSLPRVVIFTPPRPAPVWLLAHYLSGDKPSSVTARYQDLIRRNGIFHPAEPPPGPFEVLA